MKLIFSILFLLFTFETKAKSYDGLISQIEHKFQLPNNLLKSIVIIESGMKPFAINVGGKAYYFKTQQEAVEYAENLIKQGTENFDIGLAQLNYRYHEEQFNSLSEMFDPKSNLIYAAKFLKSLYQNNKSWHVAVSKYHASKLQYQLVYTRKIIKHWIGV